MRFLFSIIFFSISFSALAQVTADFNLPVEVCLDEQFQLENSSINADSYEWDFCQGDLEANDLVINQSNEGDLSIPVGTSLIKYKEFWYGFFTNITNNTITKLEFGNSLENEPLISNIGNLGGALDNPQDIKVVEENDSIYFFVSNRNNNKLVRINLGTDLNNTAPTVDVLLSGNRDLLNNGIEVVKDDNTWIVFYTGTNLLRIINLGNSLSNIPDVSDILVTSNFTGVSNIGDISLIKESNNWYGFIVGYSSRTLHRLDFGISMFSNPSVNNITPTGFSSEQPYSIKLAEEGSNKFGFISTSSGNFLRLDFGESILNTLTFTSLGNFDVLSNNFKVDIAKDGSKFVGLTSIWNANKIIIIDFPNDCEVTPEFSTEFQPITSYSTSGTYPITLTTFHPNGNSASNTKEITVSESQAPVGEIISDSAYCIADNVQFDFNTSSDIATYSWGFGDSNTSTDISPMHQYTASGEYIITLEIESTDGCPNIFYDTLIILPEPQPEFSTTETEYCTFESIDFNNITPFDFGDNVVWSWDFNGEGSSTEENPSFIFESSGTKTITIEANVLGCVVTYQSTLEIIEGPEVDFSYDSNCLGEAIQFTNLSTGANITGYQWDFGNGENSTAENPQITYNNPGTFEAILTVSNASGCENITIQNIQIFDEVVDSIYSTEAFENLPFNVWVNWNNDFDSSQNISYRWDIDGEIQTTDTAIYALSEGQYTVNLEVITAKGCVFNSQRIIEVQASNEPTPYFNLPSEVCIDENFQVQNNSMNAEKYEWDFCVGDFELTDLTIQQFTEGDLSTPIGISLIEFKGLWYGFITNITNSTITKLEFGNSLKNDPLISNIGNLGNALDQPQDIKVVTENDSIYFFVSNRNTNKFVRISMGTDLANPNPVVDVLLAGNQDLRNNGIEVVKDQNSWVAFYTGTDLLRIINLGTHLSNIPTPADILVTSSFTGVTNIADIDFVKEADNWYGFIVGSSSRTLHRLDFGLNLFSNPSSTNITPVDLPPDNPYSIKLVRDASNHYGFISTLSGNLLKLKFDDSILNTIQFSSLGKFGSLQNNFKLDIAKENSSFVALSTVWSANKIVIIDFPNDCLVSTAFSTEFEPQAFYAEPGTYPITLTAYHPNGNSASITKEITVTENQAPDIAFTTGDNLCIANAVEFESQSTAELNSYQWDFGDGEISTEANPNHTFATAGTYAVKLSVSDTSGCSNLFVDSVQVLEQPVPDFQASAQGSVCSQKPIVFDNLTTLPTEATFFWEFGDGNTSTEENPEHIYQEAGEYIVTQSINMAGCEVEKTDTISVNPGPIVAFQIANNCLDEILQFENTSQGEFLESFQWDFGDGTQSTQTNPSHLYDTAGTYNVQLTALTSNGCDFTISQDVSIQPLASVAFEAEVACANQPVQFSEQVNIAVSNITDYFWDFGVSGTQTDVSTEANPTFAFPASGSYNVRLQVTTSDGCTTDTTQTISVNALPQPDFEFENSCINENRLFTPQNIAGISAHFWELKNAQGEILQSSQSENFAYLFSQAGNYQLTYRQENENLCSNAITKSFTINELPEPDFAWGTGCAGEAVEFENLTDLNGNNLKKYNWSIDGEVISTDARPQYIFEDSGDYLLSLQVETQGGCVQSVSKEISISPVPTAFFEITQNIGAYPFTLSTSPSGQDYPLEGIIGVSSKLPTTNSQLPTSSSRSDDSQTGSSYVWLLGNDTISNSQELNYTITQPGTYLLGLILTNDAGCTDEHYEQIRVREPSLDVSLSNLRVSKDDEFTTFVLNISNRGSLVPDRIDLDVDLGSYSVTESLETPLYPESNRNFSLSLKLTDEQLRGLSKICINATPKTGDYNDSNSQNNRLCTNLESGFKVMDIYPNPAVNQFTIPLIIPETDQLTISMEDSNGRQVKIFNYDLEAGYNEIQIQRESLSPGIYFLRFRHQGQEKVKKIIFQ
ncbi:PKD domain-containing protein [Marivirga harenae]|uniref:T9SS type A sorting domain-containing protein n=1 Tax=Marivirga harenae TaxID=2010992 RepID=UPI0026E09C39|nr:PKD domain-containing protein [Marivirga harenae]WKV13434.1 PKD domain-containing protein [Marivirga harenae]